MNIKEETLKIQDRLIAENIKIADDDINAQRYTTI